MGAAGEAGAAEVAEARRKDSFHAVALAAREKACRAALVLVGDHAA